jgi:hypothetical protein
MNKTLCAVILAGSTVIGLPVAAAQPEAEITRRTLGCYQKETLHRIDELSQAGDMQSTQKLGRNSISKGDCVLLEGRTKVSREKFSGNYVCVRAAYQDDCVWISPNTVEARSASAPVQEDFETSGQGS